ncbi:MAG: TetR/AcrR family transcriptional regulator [Actinomycetota bacterium]
MVRITREQRAANRERLIDTLAAQIAAGRGRVPTVSSITAELGLARSAFYNYFDDVEDLFRAFVDRELRLLASALADRLAEVDDPVERLAVFVRAALSEFAGHGAAFEAATALGLERRVQGSEELGPLAAVLATVLRDGVAAGRFDPVMISPLVPELILRAVGTHQAAIAAGTVDLDEAQSVVSHFVRRALLPEPSDHRGEERP